MVGKIFNHSFMRAMSLCLALSFLMMSLVPAGFMPGSSSNGYSITICSGTGTKEIFVSNSPAHGDEKKDAHSKPCAFAVASHYTKPATEVFEIAQLDYTNANAALEGLTNASFELAKNYFSQGPPVFIAV